MLIRDRAQSGSGVPEVQPLEIKPAPHMDYESLEQELCLVSCYRLVPLGWTLRWRSASWHGTLADISWRE